MVSVQGKLQEVREELNCPVCLDTYEMPKRLQCFHVYCKKCLSRLVREDEQGKRTIPCPQCTKKTPVPNQGVADLPAAFQINRLLDIVGGEGEQPRQERQYCPEHQEEELKVYCEDCGELVCNKCVIGGGKHCKHEHGLLEEAFKNCKDEISLAKAQLEKQMSDTSQFLQMASECRNKILTKLNILECELDGEERKTILMQQLQHMAYKRINFLEKEEEKYKNVQSQLRSCQDFMKNTIDTSSLSVEVLWMKNDVISQIKELTVPVQPIPFSIEILHIRVACSSDDAGTKTSDCENIFAYPVASETDTYSAAILRLPTAFYYNALTGIILTGSLVKQRIFPDSNYSLHEAKLLQHTKHNHFRPPCGPPLCYLTSVGYGKEVGLPDGMQEIYDPYSKKSLILDHNTLKIVRDNRLLQPQERVLKPVFISVGSITDKNMPSHLCLEGATVREAYIRARSKPIGCTLSFRGQNGYPGADGAHGMDGSHGLNGDGVNRHGRRGEDGKRGSKGGRGTNGQNGGDAYLVLSGSADELVVSSQNEFRVHLSGNDSEQVLLIDCHGGNGGKGGCGGRGGVGGNGGDGGVERGFRRASTISDGGDGGGGGLGGPGGDTGDGGNAGSGGNCVIKTADPRLLILVEIDCMPGEPGAGDKGGGGGFGGCLGLGYYVNLGSKGRNGTSGTSGDHGLDSWGGEKAQNGGILWVVYDPSVGGDIKASSTRYEAKVEGLSVVPVLEGGIFEPNEKISVSGLIIHNTGGLDLPDGVSVSLPSSKTVNFEASKFDFPQSVLKAGEKYTIPFKFYGRLSDLAPPNKPGPQSFDAEFHPRVELFGRPFNKSRFKFLVQYPIQLGKLHSVETMDRGEVALFSIEVKNMSNLPYGKCEYSVGRVVLHLHFDSKLIPLDKSTIDTQAPYVVTYDRSLADSTFIELLELPPQKSVIVTVKVQMKSCAELFDQCHWQADLYFRDKLIEYNHKNVYITSKYNTKIVPADALLVTSEFMSHQELEFWYSIFHLLGISFDIWDSALYGGFSLDHRTGLRHRESWYGRYVGKLILYPHCINLQLLAGEDITQHFHGVNFHRKPLQELNSSLVLFMPKSKHNEMEMLRHLAEVHPNIEIPENGYSGNHLLVPSQDDSPAPYTNCERKIVKEIEEKNLRQSPLLLSRWVNITHKQFHQYSYGRVDIRQVPILKSSKFLLIDDSDRQCDDNVPPMAADIPLASRYGQAILATLYGVSIPAKLKLIKKDPMRRNVQKEVVFYLSNGSVVGMEELVMITLAWEVADELFSFSGETHRMKQIYNDIIDNTLAYVECGRIVLRGLKLIEKELKKRRSAGLKHYLMMLAFGNITEMSKGIQKRLAEAGVSNSKLEDMLSLDQLQDRSNVHFCHQHFVKDELWSLADN